jgi:hypothetical protein
LTGLGGSKKKLIRVKIFYIRTLGVQRQRQGARIEIRYR